MDSDIKSGISVLVIYNIQQSILSLFTFNSDIVKIKLFLYMPGRGYPSSCGNMAIEVKLAHVLLVCLAKGANINIRPAASGGEW